jgi:short-subunit dehydrogenase
MEAERPARFAVVVTGASAGIGRSIAKVAAREGSAIVLIARSLKGLSEAAEEVRKAGGEAYPLELDLLEVGAVSRIDAYLAQHGLLCDVLVNSAGYGLRGPAASLPIQDQLGIIDLNIRALTELTLHFLPQMLDRGRGGILNLSSVASFTPGPYMALYYSSKGFVRTLSESIYQEVRSTGVTVTCVAPGPVKTKFLKKAQADRTPLFRLLPKVDADFVAERAWKGLRSGRRLVVPGLSTKLAVFGASILPSAALAFLVGAMQRNNAERP